MQAIARVNRTYESDSGNKKESGLIVDYSNIWKYIADALLQYASGGDPKRQITMEDIEVGKNKLMDSFKIVNDYYIKNILTFDLLSPSDKYKFVINAFNHVLRLPTDEKTKFVLLARKVKRFLKISYSVITEKARTIAKCIESTNDLLSRSNVQGDENLTLTIDKIKELISKAINADSSKISIKKGRIPKDINTAADIIGDEAEILIKNSPYVAAELLKSSIEAQINQLKRIRPVLARKASDKLLNILNESERLSNIDDTIKMLTALSKKIKNGLSLSSDFKDKQLQAFFDIVSNDEYLKHNNNSEILRQIAIDLN
ncbi:MAG: DUF3387 domain-containing protein [Elusimicrobiota bacterium]|jgi:type I restriction enzyme R subunit|nr:DUF3387 domain-containing protein [Elusimicrobiota bacterium]